MIQNSIIVNYNILVIMKKWTKSSCMCIVNVESFINYYILYMGIILWLEKNQVRL